MHYMLLHRYCFCGCYCNKINDNTVITALVMLFSLELQIYLDHVIVIFIDDGQLARKKKIWLSQCDDTTLFSLAVLWWPQD